MQGYIIRRLLLIIPTLFLLGTILFMMLQFIPGDVASTLLASEENAASPEAIEKLRGELGLKDPLYVQYMRWLTKMDTIMREEWNPKVPVRRPDEFQIKYNYVMNVDAIATAKFIQSRFVDAWLDEGAPGR
jgi:hypothetical protein